MIRRNLACLYLWIEGRSIRLANWARGKADSLLPALFLALLIGSLFAGSIAVAHHLQVAAR